MPPDAKSPSTTTSPPPSAMKRKSWFSLHLRHPNSSRAANAGAGAGAGAGGKDLNAQSSDDIDDPDNPTERLRPIQFSPNRIATLYVTPSERNLYLAAMSHFDEPPRPLPLWSEPAPMLPSLTPAAPLDTSTQTNNHAQAHNGRAPSSVDHHPLTFSPMSAKLVTSPNMPFPGSGLQIRDEFRNGRVPVRTTRHALISLTPPASLRFNGFPPTALVAVNDALSEAWHLGVMSKSETGEQLRKRAASNGEGISWRVELGGRAWKRKGHQELDSIRLLLAIFTKLAIHGWTVVDSIQAAGLKKDSHNLLFIHSSMTEQLPPVFFALSLPLPDRISIISAPPKITPALITAVRNAIVSNSHIAGHSRSGTGNSGAMASSDSMRRVTWGKSDRIKLEGWVHDGVYRFWVGGMRRWLGGGLKKRVVDDLHPQLVLGLVNNLSSLHFSLAASIPMLPLAKGRDVLYFYSLPDSGMSHLDTYKPNTSRVDTIASSPILISLTDSMSPAPPPLPTRRHEPREARAARGGRESSDSDSDPRDVDPFHRVLPWTSVLDEGPPPSPRRAGQISDQRATTVPPSSMPGQGHVHRRSPSQDSSRPLLVNGSAQSSPRQKNVLLKKNSTTQRNRTASGNDSDSQTQRAANRGGGQTTSPTPPQAESESWSMVDVPLQPGQPTHAPIDPSDDVNRLSQGGRVSEEKTAESGESVYNDPQEIPITGEQIMALGQPIHPHPTIPPPAESHSGTGTQHRDSIGEGVTTVPLKEASSPKRAGSAFVEVGSGIGIPSMYGSVGNTGGQSIMSGVSGVGRESGVGTVPDVPGQGVGQGQADGDGKVPEAELGRLLRENTGEVGGGGELGTAGPLTSDPPPRGSPNRAARAGSNRTRISMK